jgi:hypothetical protein
MSVNVKRYVIDYVKYVTRGIPETFQLPIVVSLVLVISAPVVLVYNLLLAFRNQILYKLMITPQVVYLEKMLNDRYDTEERRITITDAKEYNAVFIFKKIELKPVFLFLKSEVGFLSTFFYLKNETGQFTWDFIVNVPVLVDFNMNELTALVNTYKLPAKTFKIKII